MRTECGAGRPLGDPPSFVSRLEDKTPRSSLGAPQRRAEPPDGVQGTEPRATPDGGAATRRSGSAGLGAGASAVGGGVGGRLADALELAAKHEELTEALATALIDEGAPGASGAPRRSAPLLAALCIALGGSVDVWSGTYGASSSGRMTWL